MLLTWFRTVIGEMNSARPISALDNPSASRVSTSCSRADRSGKDAESRPRRTGEERQHPPGQVRAEDGVPAGDRTDRAHDLTGIGALDQVAAGPGAQGGEHRVVVLRHGQHQDAGADAGLGQPAGRRQTAELGHGQVHDDDVGIELLDQAHGLGAGRRLPDDRARRARARG